MPDDRDALRRRLELARARRDREPAYSPDWDAAVADIEEIMAKLARPPMSQRTKTPTVVMP